MLYKHKDNKKYDHAFYNKPILSHCLHGKLKTKMSLSMVRYGTVCQSNVSENSRSKISCRYADIFRDEFETKHIYPRISNDTLVYFQFVDDIFMIFLIFLLMHFYPGTMTTHAESINRSTAWSGQTFTTHTTLSTEQNQ